MSLSQLIKTAIPTVLSTLASNFGLKVSFSGSPSTDGHTVHLGRVPMHAKREDADLIYMHGLHEIGHVMYSDFETFINYSKSAPKAARMLLNAIEDPRTDHLVTRKYPGFRRLRERGKRYMLKLGICRTGDNSFVEAYSMFVYALGYTTLMQSEFHTEDMPRIRALVANVSEPLARETENLCAKRYPKLKSTDDARQFADELIDLIYQHIPQPPSESRDNEQPEDEESQDSKSEGQGGDSGDGDSSSNSSNDESEGDGGDAGGDSEEDSNTQQSGDAGDGESDSDGDGCADEDDSEDAQSGDQESGDGKPEPGDLDWLEAQAEDQAEGDPVDGEIEKLIQRLVTEAVDQGIGRTSDSAALGAGGGHGHPPSHDLARYDRLKSSGDAVQRELRKLLVNAEKPGYVRARKGKRLDASRAALWRTGQTRIWKRKRLAKQRDVSMALLVDDSGSMAGGRAELATQATIEICEACEGFVDVDVVSFGSDTFVLKDRNAKLASSKASIGGLKGEGGGTNLKGGLFLAGSRLLSSPNANRVLIVVTDGQANRPHEAKEMVQTLEQSGIRVIGLGLETEAVKTVFDHSEVLIAGQLAGTLSRLVQLAKFG